MWWKPLAELERLRQEIERTFEEAGFRGRRNFTGLFDSTFPKVNIFEDENKVYLELMAPGVDPNSWKITVTNNVINISGERKAPKVKGEYYHRQERKYGKFTRSFELPSKIDRENINATYKNGILSIELMKAESEKPREIEVKVG